MQKLLADKKKVFLLFLIIALLFFGNSIGNSYSFDDSYVTVTNFKEAGQKYVPNNSSVALGFKGIPKIWRSRYGHGSGTAFDYRPVVNTVFAIEYALLGQSPRASHFINVVLYACVLFMLFLVLKKVLVNYSYREPFAFFCCLLFAAHPIHTEVVDSLKSRDELLGLIFGLLCMWHTLRFEETRNRLAVAWAVVFFFLAIYSKLTAAVFAGIIPLTLWLFAKVKRRQLLYVVLVAGVLFLIQSQVRRIMVTEKELRILYHFENPMATEQFSLMMRCMFALKTLGVYIRLLVFPWPLRYYYGSAVITSDVSLVDTDVWIALIFTVAAIVFCFRSRSKLAIYGSLFFFVSIAPVLNFVRPVAGIVGERLTFIPSVGFIFFVTAAVFHFYKDPPVHFKPAVLYSKPVVYLSFCLPVFLLYDWSRNGNWKDEITLFEHDAVHLERSAGANNLLATKYAEFLYKGDPRYPQSFLVEKCWEHYNLAIKADSSVYVAINNAGTIALRYMNDPQLALDYFLRCARIHSDYPQVYENIGDCYLTLGKKQEAISAYQTAVAQNQDQYRSYIQLGFVLIDLNKYDEAIMILSKAEKRFPSSYSVAERLGTCYYLKGEKLKGLDQLERAYALRPTKELAATLANYFQIEGQTVKANTYLEMSK